VQQERAGECQAPDEPCTVRFQLRYCHRELGASDGRCAVLGALCG